MNPAEEIRYSCLQLANSTSIGTDDQIVARAAAFEKFIKGTDSGEEKA